MQRWLRLTYSDKVVLFAKHAHHSGNRGPPAVRGSLGFAPSPQVHLWRPVTSAILTLRVPIDIWNESSLQPVWSDGAAFSQPNGVEGRAEVCDGLPVSPRMGGRKVTVELRDESACVGSYHGVNLLTATRDEAMGGLRRLAAQTRPLTEHLRRRGIWETPRHRRSLHAEV
jgi:hypothetical protein